MEPIVKSLSWSRIYSWTNSKKQFIKTYFEKEPFFETKEIIFGSALGKMIEIQEYHNEDRIVEECLKNWHGEIVENKRKEGLLRKSINNIKSLEGFIEKLQELEFDLYSEYENKFQDFIGRICTFGYSDNCSADWKGLKEFKTGKTLWNTKRVNEHGQLDLYCLLTYLKKGYFPESVELIWFPTTQNENGEIVPTGEIKTIDYDVEANKERILSWEHEIPKIFEEIQQAQIEWEQQKDNKQEVKNYVFLEKFEAYKKLEEEKKKIEEVQKTIKDDIEAQMNKYSLKDYKIEGLGSVFYTQRKSYEYDENIKNAEDTLKQIKKDFEKTHEPIIKESLSFRLSK